MYVQAEIFRQESLKIRNIVNLNDKYWKNFESNQIKKSSIENMPNLNRHVLLHH